ncbi:MAG TPA: ATP-binding cassette domain-containing protein [Mycobacteriales bacterium]|jgi:ABC-type branched-subunit amino acid transport system ATPase component/ABC-type branched-subunit amino acid transport system permease subunit|nr:ATP-binding cassette domain-containing protein [Mycobacteriales bacterium]
MKTAKGLQPIAVTTAVLGGALLVAEFVLPHWLHVSGTLTGRWQTPASAIVLGLTIGLTYGLLAVGLVLIYRSSRVINFAQGQMGAFGSVAFFLLVTKAHFPYWVALTPALLIAGGVGAVTETAVIRRLGKAPLAVSVVATLGVGLFLVLFGALIDPSAGAGGVFPVPPGMPSFSVGALEVTPAYSAMLILSPILVLLVGGFLRYSRIGVAMRCAADNPEAARMAGIFAGRMNSLAWALGSAVAAFAAIMSAPTLSVEPGQGGTQLLEIALAAAVIGRMDSLPLTLVAGTAIGVLEQLLLWNFGETGAESLILFAMIVGGALLLLRSPTGRTEEKGSWTTVAPPRPIPSVLRQLPSVRALGPALTVVVLAGLALLPLGITNADSVTMTQILSFVIVGFSVGLVTGLGGQLSIGQFGIAAVGAIASYEIASRTHDYLLSFLYAGVAAALVMVVLGLFAIRAKGLFLTVTTLSFALLVTNWLLPASWLFGFDGVTPGHPSVMGFQLDTGKRYYWFALAITAICFVITRNIRAAGLSRLFVAVRDNEDNARAFTVPATAVKIRGYAIAGFLAGIGGAVFAHSLSTHGLGGASFGADDSLNVTVMTVVGGIGSLIGPILGALYVFVLPDFGHLQSLAIAGTALGQLLIIVYLPGGLVHLLTPFRDAVVKFLGRRAGVDVDAAYLADSSSASAVEIAAPNQAPPLTVVLRPVGVRPILEAAGLVKSFGGVHAVRGVSLAVNRGETLGLIGPNGAGKTTTFELLAGFTSPDRGLVRLHDEDVTTLGPEARAQRGLIRSFQDAALFPTLTVQECVTLALERTDPSTVTAAVLGLTSGERRKEARARELVSWMGLDRYRAAQVQNLSTGTRRIAELACLVGLGPEVLLLDEPCAGIAQRETEALQDLLATLKRDLDLTLCIIEHDIPMIMSMSDRIVCMAEGEIIAEGTPDVIRNDRHVVEAYLGGSLTAIQRSGVVDSAKAATKKRKPALVRTAG